MDKFLQSQDSVRTIGPIHLDLLVRLAKASSAACKSRTIRQMHTTLLAHTAAMHAPCLNVEFVSICAALYAPTTATATASLVPSVLCILASVVQEARGVRFVSLLLAIVRACAGSMSRADIDMARRLGGECGDVPMTRELQVCVCVCVMNDIYQRASLGSTIEIGIVPLRY